MRRFWKLTAPVWVVGLVLVWLPGERIAVADDVSDTNDTVFGDGMIYVPPADLTGWFFNPDDPVALPPSDPSQIWTSPGNIATLNQWLQLATDLGDDPSVLQEMYGFGMISAPNAAAVTAAEEVVAQVQNSGAPEPVGFALLAAGLLVMGVVAGMRTRRMGRYS
jgi:hypothetical protein